MIHPRGKPSLRLAGRKPTRVVYSSDNLRRDDREGDLTEAGWPRSADELEALQRELARLEPPPWRPVQGRRPIVGGVFVASATGLVGTGTVGDPLWAAAVAIDVGGGTAPVEAVARGEAGGPYLPGLLALREGPSLETAIRALGVRPDVVLVNGTGRDHPRRAGIALHLGAVLDAPTVGVTVRPLVAESVEPPAERGAASPLVLDREVVGFALRTRPGARPVFVHAAWRTVPDVAREVVLLVIGRYRTPDPIRLARRLARLARARDEGRSPAPGSDTHQRGS
jgi:deoxyribonuclease V